MHRVLVLDGKLLSTVAIIRSLVKKEIVVDCGEEYRTCPAFFSKYVKNKVVYPSPSKEPDLFIEKIFSLVQNNRYELIIPVSDETTILLSKYKVDLSKFTRIPTPDYQTIMIARNKALTVKYAINSEIPCPKTIFPDEQNINDIKDIIDYPVLIKPCESSGGRGIRYIITPNILISEIKKIKEIYDQVIIQEFIPSNKGRYLLHALFGQDQKPIAACVLQALRCYPVNGGPTAYGKTVIQPEIMHFGLRLLEAMKWQGVAEIEFLIDKRDGQPKLMEVNHRFGMPVGLAIEAGVDIPGLLYEMMVNRQIKKVFDYKIGTKWRWFFPQDVLWFFTAKHKISSLRDFCQFIDKDLHYADFSFSDVGPSLGIILQSLRYFFNKEKRNFVLKRGW